METIKGTKEMITTADQYRCIDGKYFTDKDKALKHELKLSLKDDFKKKINLTECDGDLHELFGIEYSTVVIFTWKEEFNNPLDIEMLQEMFDLYQERPSNLKYGQMISIEYTEYNSNGPDEIKGIFQSLDSAIENVETQLNKLKTYKNGL